MSYPGASKAFEVIAEKSIRMNNYDVVTALDKDE
jgi:hypothetical protein